MKHLNLNDVARNAKRGALKAFREYLNKRFSHLSYTNRRWGQITRSYGDWVYFQDRDMFDEMFSRAMEGRDFEGFDHTKYLNGKGE